MITDEQIDQYEKEHEELKRELELLKLRVYQQLRELVRTPDMIRLSGFKSLEDAVQRLVSDNDRECEKKLKAHEKKWPDDVVVASFKREKK